MLAFCTCLYRPNYFLISSDIPFLTVRRTAFSSRLPLRLPIEAAITFLQYLCASCKGSLVRRGIASKTFHIGGGYRGGVVVVRPGGYVPNQDRPEEAKNVDSPRGLPAPEYRSDCTTTSESNSFSLVQGLPGGWLAG